MTPYIAEMGVAHRIAPYTTEKSQVKSPRISTQVTKSPWKFCQSLRVTEVILMRSRGHSQILGSHSHKYCAYWSDHPWIGITYPRHMHKIPLITWQSWLSHIHGPTRFRSRHNSWNKVSGCRQGQESGEIGIVVSTHMHAQMLVYMHMNTHTAHTYISV